MHRVYRLWIVQIAVVALMALAGSVIGSGSALADEPGGGSWYRAAFKTTPTSSGYSALGYSSSTSTSRAKSKSKGVQVASLGSYTPPTSYGGSLSGGGKINWVASSGCLNSSLRGMISSVAANYGSVTVSSTCRSHSHNARVGGAKKSYHLTGDAADFRVHGNWGAAYSYLQSAHYGMVKHYGGGLFHIDTGPKGRF